MPSSGWGVGGSPRAKHDKGLGRSMTLRTRGPRGSNSRRWALGAGEKDPVIEQAWETLGYTKGNKASSQRV